MEAWSPSSILELEDLLIEAQEQKDARELARQERVQSRRRSSAPPDDSATAGENAAEKPGS